MNVDVSANYIWNHCSCTCGNGKYVESIIDNSLVTCDEIIDAIAKLYKESSKSIPINFTEKKATCKMDNLYILFVLFLLPSCY